MKYYNIKNATFLSRPNRFIAICEVDGKEEICHIKNTGRCRELLINGASVYLEESKNPKRKTKLDLVAVEKGKLLINVDSYAPNIVFGEFLKDGGLFSDITFIRPETKYKNSRFDFYIEYADKKAFIEVKGVTLEENGVLLFPDAPTERGVKHIFELCEAKSEGYDAYIVFVVQMKNAKYFTPNRKTQPAFADALIYAKEYGVNVLAYTCNVTHDSISIKNELTIKI